MHRFYPQSVLPQDLKDLDEKIFYCNFCVPKNFGIKVICDTIEMKLRMSKLFEWNMEL